MDFLGPFHPIFVHAPTALIVVSVLFELVGIASDSQWLRKAALALLLLGVVGGVGAILSGEAASEVAEHRQGIPESRIEWHEDIAKLSVWLGGGALVARGVAAAIPGGRAAIALVALLLQLASGVAVTVAGYRGGRLVYEHGAGVRVDGGLVRSATAEVDSSGH